LNVKHNTLIDVAHLSMHFAGHYTQPFSRVKNPKACTASRLSSLIHGLRMSAMSRMAGKKVPAGWRRVAGDGRPGGVGQHFQRGCPKQLRPTLGRRSVAEVCVFWNVLVLPKNMHAGPNNSGKEWPLGRDPPSIELRPDHVVQSS